MKIRRIIIVLAAVVALLLGVFLGMALASDPTMPASQGESRPTPVAADPRQPGEETEPPLWLGTAPVPPGTPAELLSPPDVPASEGVPSEAMAAPLQTYSYLRVAGSVLRPRVSDVEWAAGGAGGCIYATSGDPYTWWNTPVYLEDGATVKLLRMYYDDTNGSANCSAYFTVYDLYGDIVDEWGVNSSGSGGEAYRTTSEFTHTVNYSLYSYVIHWRPNDLGSDVQLCGFRIYYYSPSSATFLPTIFRNHH